MEKFHSSLFLPPVVLLDSLLLDTGIVRYPKHDFLLSIFFKYCHCVPKVLKKPPQVAEIVAVLDSSIMAAV